MSALGPAIGWALAGGACSWTQFDDLADETWVGATEKPGVDSSSYGLAIQRGVRAGNGGRLVVVGTGQPTRSELVFSPEGDSSLAPSALELNTQFGISTIEAQPILIADPTSDDVSLIVNSGGNQITVLTGTGQINLHQVFVGSSTVDAATYMQPPPRIDTAHAGEAQPAQPLIAAGEAVAGTFFTSVPNPQPYCKLVDGGMSVAIRALGVVRRPDGFDDVLAWGTSGKLYRYASEVFNGCVNPATSAVEPLDSVDTGFPPGRGSQIIAYGADHVILQGHKDADDASLLQVFEAGTLTPVGPAASQPKLRSAALLQIGAQDYVIGGYPTQVVDGKTAGQVMLFAISATTGVDTVPVATFNDAQPEGNKAFGRAVAAMPFNGAQVIAVAADNEIFVYFRANLTDGSPLYDETRQGR